MCCDGRGPQGEEDPGAQGYAHQEGEEEEPLVGRGIREVRQRAGGERGRHPPRDQVPEGLRSERTATRYYTLLHTTTHNYIIPRETQAASCQTHTEVLDGLLSDPHNYTHCTTIHNTAPLDPTPHSNAQQHTEMHNTAQHRTAKHSNTQHCKTPQSNPQHRTTTQYTSQQRTAPHNYTQHRTVTHNNAQCRPGLQTVQH